jgi:Na+-driven multidrug efflux pump
MMGIEVVSLVASILPIVALFQVFDGAAAVTAGILRARGKQASISPLPIHSLLCTACLT